MTLQQYWRTQPFTKNDRIPTAQRIQAENLAGEADDDEYWDQRYRSEGELYDLIQRIAPQLNFRGKAIPMLDNNRDRNGKSNPRLFAVGNRFNADRGDYDRVVFQFIPEKLKKYMANEFMKDGGRSIEEIADDVYHLTGAQPASDFPDDDLSIFYPDGRYIGSGGQYTMLPSSSARKDFNPDGSIKIMGRTHDWYEAPEVDKVMLDRLQRQLKATGSLDADSQARLDEILAAQAQRDAEDISKHVVSRGAITGVASDSIYPFAYGLRTIAPYRTPRLNAKQARDRDIAINAAKNPPAKEETPVKAGRITAEEIEELAKKLEAKGDVQAAYELRHPKPVEPAASPTSAEKTTTKKTDADKKTGSNPGKKKPAPAPSNTLGDYLKAQGFTLDPVRGEIIDDETGEVMEEGIGLGTPSMPLTPIRESAEQETTPADPATFQKSTAEMFAEMRAARNAKRDVVTDESGKIDIVNTSTHSLFERMKRRR